MTTFNLESIIRINTHYSRREIMSLLQEKAIKINGQVATQINMPIDPKKDHIIIHNRPIPLSTQHVYYAFHKPAGIICTMDDPRNRRSLRQYTDKLPYPVFPVGRLDKETTGLLFLTNDGQFSQKICHPSFEIEKKYIATLDKPLKLSDESKLLSGFFLEDGPVNFSSCHQKNGPNTYAITIYQGRNRIVRRSFEFFGYQVIALHRLSIGNFSIQDVPKGKILEIPQELIDSLLEKPAQ